MKIEHFKYIMEVHFFPPGSKKQTSNNHAQHLTTTT